MRLESRACVLAKSPKTTSASISRICYGRDTSKKLYDNLDGRKLRIGNVCSFIGNKGYFSVYVDDIKVAGMKQKHGSHVEEIGESCGH